jgi:hypothetical protein
MKSVKLTFALIFIYLMFSNFGCNCDDDQCITGRVLYRISCQSENGPGWLIERHLGNSRDTILTTTLPAAFEDEGRRIFFSTTPPSGNTHCTANLTAREEFDIFNVSSGGCQGDD